jgi:hypothetical protein
VCESCSLKRMHECAVCPKSCVSVLCALGPVRLLRSSLPDFVAKYLMAQSSPALLDKLANAVKEQLPSLLGNTRVQDSLLYIKVWRLGTVACTCCAHARALAMCAIVWFPALPPRAAPVFSRPGEQGARVVQEPALVAPSPSTPPPPAPPRSRAPSLTALRPTSHIGSCVCGGTASQAAQPVVRQ